MARSKVDSAEDFAFTALEVLWASAFAAQLPRHVEDSLSHSVLKKAAKLDEPHQPPAAPAFSLRSDAAAATVSATRDESQESWPRVVGVYSDRLVVHKPAGWQARHPGTELSYFT